MKGEDISVSFINNQSYLKGAPILAICPTRERVKKCGDMLKGFEDNQSGSIDLLFCIDEDDPQLKGYKALLSDDVAYLVQPPMTITEIYNKVAIELLPDYQIYHQANDDFRYRTKNFDKTIVKEFKKSGQGIYYCDDGFWRNELCVAPFITSEVIKATGWLQLPSLKHLCSDLVWQEIGEALSIINYLPSVYIMHDHPETTGIPKDATTLRVNSPEMYRHDKLEFIRWMRNDSASVIALIRATLEKKSL